MFSPVVVLKFGPKTCLIVSSLPYLLYILQLFYISSAYIIITSVMLGLAAPVLWTSLGTFLSNNSDMRTINRNSGVFWAMNQSSIFLGNNTISDVVDINEWFRKLCCLSDSS